MKGEEKAWEDSLLFKDPEQRREEEKKMGSGWREHGFETAALLAWRTSGLKFEAGEKGGTEEGAFEESGVRTIVMDPGRQQKMGSRTR